MGTSHYFGFMFSSRSDEKRIGSVTRKFENELVIYAAEKDIHPFASIDKNSILVQ